MDPHSFYADQDPAVLSCKKHKDCSKVRNIEACANLKLNKVAVTSNFLAFFQFLVDKFTVGKMNADPCGSGSTALGKPEMCIFLLQKHMFHAFSHGLGCVNTDGTSRTVTMQSISSTLRNVQWVLFLHVFYKYFYSKQEKKVSKVFCRLPVNFLPVK